MSWFSESSKGMKSGLLPTGRTVERSPVLQSVEGEATIFVSTRSVSSSLLFPFLSINTKASWTINKSPLVH